MKPQRESLHKQPMRKPSRVRGPLAMCVAQKDIPHMSVDLKDKRSANKKSVNVE